MADLDNIKIIKEKRKSLAVEVYPNFSVVIKSPEQAKDFEIKDFIKRKTPWIEKQINYFKQFNMPEDKIPLNLYQTVFLLHMQYLPRAGAYEGHFDFLSDVYGLFLLKILPV